MSQKNPPHNDNVMNVRSNFNHRTFRQMRVLLALSFLLGLITFSIACLPASYTMQIKEVINCSDHALSEGLFDVDVADSYKMVVKLTNWLTTTASPATFTSEANYIELRKVKIWFAYPTTLTLPPSDALYIESNPREVLIYGRLDPTIQGTFEGVAGGSGGSGTATANEVPISFKLIPPETALTLKKFLKNLEKNSPKNTSVASIGVNITIIANVVLYGQTGTGSEVTTPTLKFPISICKGCLDNTSGDKVICETGGTSTACVGQDNNCYSKNEEGGN